MVRRRRSNHGSDASFSSLRFVGLRWGELVGLRRGDVDLDNRTTYVSALEYRVFTRITTGGSRCSPTSEANMCRRSASAHEYELVAREVRHEEGEQINACCDGRQGLDARVAILLLAGRKLTACAHRDATSTSDLR